MALQILKRINAEIEDRRAAGENLPPPPKTAIAGPEYFGFNQGEVLPCLSASSMHCTFAADLNVQSRFLPLRGELADLCFADWAES